MKKYLEKDDDNDDDDWTLDEEHDELRERVLDQ